MIALRNAEYGYWKQHTVKTIRFAEKLLSYSFFRVQAASLPCLMVTANQKLYKNEPTEQKTRFFKLFMRTDWIWCSPNGKTSEHSTRIDVTVFRYAQTMYAIACLDCQWKKVSRERERKKQHTRITTIKCIAQTYPYKWTDRRGFQARHTNIDWLVNRCIPRAHTHIHQMNHFVEHPCRDMTTNFAFMFAILYASSNWNSNLSKDQAFN